MQRLFEEWKELTVHKYISSIIDICGTKTDKYNSKFSKADQNKIFALFEKGMKELLQPEQLVFLKAVGYTCLQVFTHELVESLTLDEEALLLLVSKHSHNVKNVIHRHLGMSVFESKELLLNLVKNHRHWISSPDFLSTASASVVESIAFFLWQSTRVDDLSSFQSVIQHRHKPSNESIKSMILSGLHNFSKGNFFDFIRIVSQHNVLSSILSDDHSKTLVLNECILYFQKTSVDNACIVVQALGEMARSGYLIENMHKVFSQRPLNENLEIMKSFFGLTTTVSNEFLQNFEDIIIREDPTFFFQKTGRFARNLYAIHSLFTHSEQIFRSCYENINFLSLAKNQSFMLSLLEIPNMGNKLRNSYENFRLFGGSNDLWIFSMFRCILSKENYRSFSYARSEILYKAKDGTMTLFFHMTLPFMIRHRHNQEWVLHQGILHPMDLLIATRLLMQINNADFTSFIHKHASILFPLNFSPNSECLFPVLLSNPRTHFSPYFNDTLELISCIMDPSEFPFTIKATHMVNGVATPLIMNRRGRCLIDVKHPIRIKFQDWQRLQEQLIKIMGVSLVQIFFPTTGIIWKYTVDEETLSNNIIRLHLILFPTNTVTMPWFSFFFHPFFRTFFPKMSDYNLWDNAVTNVFYGENFDDESSSINFDMHLRHVKFPYLKINRSIMEAREDDAVLYACSTQEVHNQMLIRAQFKAILESEVMQVKALVTLVHHLQMKAFQCCKNIPVYKTLPLLMSSIPINDSLEREQQLLMRRSSDDKGSPWIPIITGREYSNHCVSSVHLDCERAGKKRQRKTAELKTRFFNSCISESYIKKGDAYLNILYCVEPLIIFKIYKHLVKKQMNQRPSCLMPISHIIPKEWWQSGVQHFRTNLLYTYVYQSADPPPVGLTVLDPNMIVVKNGFNSCLDSTVRIMDLMKKHETTCLTLPIMDGLFILSARLEEDEITRLVMPNPAAYKIHDVMGKHAPVNYSLPY